MSNAFSLGTPWRTRGAFDPNSGQPTAALATSYPGEAITNNDAFVVTALATGTTLSGLSNSGDLPTAGASPGDLLVYNGGTITAWSGWTYVPRQVRDGDPPNAVVINVPSRNT